MRRYLIIFFTLIFIISPTFLTVSAQQDPNNPVDNPAPRPTINIIGDSLTEGSLTELKTAFPTASIDPRVSRQWGEGITILQNLASSGDLARTIVFALGTNGATDDAGVDKVMQITGTSKVIFMTIYGTTAAAQENSNKQNEVINRALARYPGKVAIADWSAVASLHPEWFEGDSLGVHPNAEGQQAFTQIITNAVGSNPTSTLQTRTTRGSAKSNMFCVKVGEPSEEKPAICNQAPSSSFGSGQAGNFTFYCQGNPQWDQKGNSCSIGQVGCGPTSMAMIFSYFGDTVTPNTMTDTYFSNSLMNCGSGSFPGNVNAWVAKQPGYEVGPDIGSGTLNAVTAKKYIDAGWLILGSSDNFIGQKGNPIGHIFVVQDVDPAAGTFLLRDPENCSYSTGEEFTQNQVQPILGGKVPSWKYAYPIRKQSSQPQPVPGANQNAF